MIGEDKPLRAYERHIAVMLIAIMLGMGLLSLRESGSGDANNDGETVRVHVVGAAVEADIAIPRGTSVDEALKRVQVDRSADLTEVDGNRRIMREETLVIPYAGKVTLFVTGAVETPRLVALDGVATAAAIMAQVTLSENADRSGFLRRKKFTTGTVIEIKPKRNRTRSQ